MAVDVEELRAQGETIRRLYRDRAFSEARRIAREAAAGLPEPTLKEGRTEALARLDLARALGMVGEGRWARRTLDQALEVAERALGKDHPDLAGILLAQASVLARVVYYPEIEPVLRRAVEIRERALGEDHRETGLALLEWAEAIDRHWHRYLARPIARRAEKILKCELSLHHPAVLRCREIVVMADRETRRAEELAAELEEIARERQRIQGPEHPDLLRTLETLLDVAPGGDRVDAVYARALALSSRLFGADSPRAALVHLAYAERQLRQSDAAGALGPMREALDILEAAWASDDPERMPVFGKLTMLLTWADPVEDVAPLREKLRALKGADART